MVLIRKVLAALSASTAACLFIAAFTAAGIFAAARLKRKYQADGKLTLLAVLLCSVGMLLAVIGRSGGTLIAVTTGNPRQTTAEFLDSVVTGDYAAAYDLLSGYTSLGLETEPDSESGKRICEALRGSYAYELAGPADTDDLTAVQKVRFTYLSLPETEKAVVEETYSQLTILVQNLPVNEVYDENNNYLPEIAERAYLLALEAVLENAESCRTTEEIPLTLHYADGRWQVEANDSLLNALNGGIDG